MGRFAPVGAETDLEDRVASAMARMHTATIVALGAMLAAGSSSVDRLAQWVDPNATEVPETSIVAADLALIVVTTKAATAAGLAQDQAQTLTPWLWAQMAPRVDSDALAAEFNAITAPMALVATAIRNAAIEGTRDDLGVFSPQAYLQGFTSGDAFAWSVAVCQIVDEINEAIEINRATADMFGDPPPAPPG